MVRRLRCNRPWIACSRNGTGSMKEIGTMSDDVPEPDAKPARKTPGRKAKPRPPVEPEEPVAEVPAAVEAAPPPVEAIVEPPPPPPVEAPPATPTPARVIDHNERGFDAETNSRYEEIKKGNTYITQLQQMSLAQLQAG